MRKKTAYTSFLLALTCCSTAHAAKNVEVVRYPSLLMFGGISQSVGVSFSYAEHKTENSSSSGTALRENYSFGTTAAVLDPHLLTLQAIGGVSYSQNFGDTTTTLLNGEYNILGSAFDMSYHPVIIGSSRSTAVISNGYTPSYSITNMTHQISMSLMNTILPLQGYYAYSTSETEGLDDDSSGSTNTLGFSAQHYLKGSDSRVSFSHGRAESEGTDSSSYNAQFTNTFTFDEADRYRLNTFASISETESGVVPQRNITLGEALSMRFGKALSGALAGNYTSTSNEDFGGNEQRTRTSSITASLAHQLYQSLSTSVSGGYSQGDSIGGETYSYGGNVRVGYTKILPAQSLLSLSIDRSSSIQSQNLQDPSTDLREIISGVIQDQLIPPPTVTGKVTVVDVISFSPLAGNPELQDPAVPVITYLPGVDYEVETGGAIRILLGGRVPNDSSIVASYTILADEEVEIRIDSTTSTASLGLFGGRYNVSATYGVQSQELVSGEAENQGLVDSRSFSVVAAANYHPTLLGAEYSRQSSSQETSSRVSVYASHTLTTDEGESMSFNARNTYSMLEKDQQGNSSSGQNNLSVSATYTRRIFRWVSFAASVGAADSRGNGRASDFINVRASASGAYNQLQFSLTGQTLYRIVGSGTTRDSNFTASITRFF